MGNRLSFGAEGTHEAEILQSPSTKDEANAAGGYITNTKNKILFSKLKKKTRETQTSGEQRECGK